MLDFSFPSALNSRLLIRNLTRAHQHAVYTCQASNFHKRGVSTNITIELYRKYRTFVRFLFFRLNVGNLKIIKYIISYLKFNSSTDFGRDSVQQSTAVGRSKLSNRMRSGRLSSTGQNYMVDGWHRNGRAHTKGNLLLLLLGHLSSRIYNEHDRLIKIAQISVVRTFFFYIKTVAMSAVYIQ